MGVVYRAEDTRLGRHVALKILREDLATDVEWNRRFHHEVRVASAVTHPGIATVYDFHHDGETAFFTMEYVEGRNLREVVDDGPMPLPRLIDASLQMAEALAVAHRKGVVHRDLKPENVMASDSGFYKILDFGLARLDIAGGDPGSGSQLKTVSADTTGSGRLVGTVAYMSPEQAQGNAVDARSDIFTFGSLLYELATGLPAFRKKNAIATFHAIVHEQPAPLRNVRPGLPPRFERIVSRCLAKDPARRYPSTDALAEDLRALAQETGSAVGRIPWAAPGTRPGRRVWLWGSAALITVAAIAALFLTMRGPGEVVQGVAPATPAATAALPDAARTEPAVSTPAASGYLAVSAFANNTGDADADWMKRGLAEMLTTELAATGDFNVISTQRLYDLLAVAGRADLGSAEQATVTELARWAGAAMVVTGSIVRSAAGYRVDAQVYDTATGRVLTATKAEGEDVARMPALLAAGLAQGLRSGKGGAAPVAPAPALARIAPEASRSYTTGLELYHDLRFSEAAKEFQRSVSADPAFSLARLRLGMSLYLEGRKEAGLKALDEAAARAQDLPERERRLLVVIKDGLEGKEPATVDSALAGFVRRYPHDQEALFWKAQAASDVSGDPIAAIRILRGILEKEPDNLPAVSAMSMQLARLGRPGDARGILEDYIGRHPEAAEPLRKIIVACETAAAEGPLSPAR